VTVDAFYLPGDEPGAFTATEHTGGPWDPGLQHGGPPAALLTRALESLDGLDGPLVRVSVDILGPVAVGEVRVEARVERPGRSVELGIAELRSDGRVAARATGWRIRRTDQPLPTGAGEPVEPPPAFPDTDAPAPRWPGGFLRAMQWRVAAGDWSTLGPATVWGRMRIDLVADEPTSPSCRVMILADCGNGASAALDHAGWVFINPELTVHLSRPPAGEWFCLDASSALDPTGFGLARSRLFDRDGLVGRGAQSLFVAAR
jgi:hypothetical protein